eukprot:Gb_01698 [translate_table: standard]
MGGVNATQGNDSEGEPLLKQWTTAWESEEPQVGSIGAATNQKMLEQMLLRWMSPPLVTGLETSKEGSSKRKTTEESNGSKHSGATSGLGGGKKEKGRKSSFCFEKQIPFLPSIRVPPQCRGSPCVREPMED